MLTPSGLLKLFLCMLFSFALVACGGEMDHSEHGQTDHNMAEGGAVETEFTAMSDDGKFHLTLTKDESDLMINELHTWTLTVQGSDMSTAVEDAVITFGGGMPEHNHGFPTEPTVSDHMGDGNYHIEGVKFQMGGNWEMDFTIEAGGDSDTAKFKIVVPS